MEALPLGPAEAGAGLPASLEARLASMERQLKDLRATVMPAHWAALDRVDALLPQDRPLTCPLCERVAPRTSLEIRVDTDIFGGGRLERYVCAGCGCGFGPFKVMEAPEAVLNADYTLLYEDYRESSGTEPELRAFRLLGPIGAPVLNWGCGRWSESIATLRAEGHDVWGYEPAAPPEDGSFIVGQRGAISPVFGSIFSNNVIEHMVDPVADFRFFHDVLRPGARMAHASPCHEWLYAFTRFHVFFPMGDSPHVLAERTGFRVVEQVRDGEFICYVYERI
ncbi:class I SAM-dependent methyltransferase [Roseomonas xinghualingensis]|uniref:class I SAM-dependent methyltransferase n=1 Tax=Roseomonas xinghualingensis TaxID=2986475 RepID=UPI0021F13534|nr:class I SAM-dependent methyltransferase [Roseomonas sp. SXEYE001]MCV4207311.1 class I SAM-dependent methyltransferase [Roseomonas sp. SXEYE001]